MSSLDTFQSTLTKELQDQDLTHDLLWRPSSPDVIRQLKEILLDTLLSLYPTLKSDTGTALFARREHKDARAALDDARDLVEAHLELLESNLDVTYLLEKRVSLSPPQARPQSTMHHSQPTMHHPQPKPQPRVLAWDAMLPDIAVTPPTPKS